MVLCIRCKGKMYQDISSGRVENGSCATVRITGYRCSQCGNWFEVYLTPQPTIVAVEEPVIETASVIKVEPVAVAEDCTASVYALAVAYFDNIASMLRHKTGWHTIARLIQHACGAPVDEVVLQQGYEAEKERRVDLRRQNRKKAKAVAA